MSLCRMLLISRVYLTLGNSEYPSEQARITDTSRYTRPPLNYVLRWPDDCYIFQHSLAAMQRPAHQPREEIRVGRL